MTARAPTPSGLAPGPVSERVRGLTPLVVGRHTTALDRWGGERLVFWVTLAAIVSQVLLPANLLLWIGIPYSAPGGPPFVKFHPGTYLAVLAVVLQARLQRPAIPALLERIAAAPQFPLVILLILLCACYALLNAGMTGTAVYIESYASAAFLGFALEARSPRELRRIGAAMLALFTLNALLSIGETVLHRHLVPTIRTDLLGRSVVLPDYEGEFRGTALYDHPLTGAMMTMMGVLLCLATSLPPALKAGIVGVLSVGLITFGGRAAMAVTCLVVGAVAAGHVVRRAMHRRMSGSYLAGVLALLVAVPSALVGILLFTSLGERIAGKLYADDSASVRVVQWVIPGRMDLPEWLFGLTDGRLGDLMRQIGLEQPLNDIENFWLLVFLNLGLVGCAFWVSGLGIMLHRLWRENGLFPRLIVAAVLTVASTNNSLGRKSNVLFICVAAAMTAGAFATPRPPPVRGPFARSPSERLPMSMRPAGAQAP